MTNRSGIPLKLEHEDLIRSKMSIYAGASSVMKDLTRVLSTFNIPSSKREGRRDASRKAAGAAAGGKAGGTAGGKADECARQGPAEGSGIVSAPLWDSHTSTFAGLLTTSDYINVIQYYWQNPEALNQIDQFKLNIEKAIGVLPLETVSVHPARPLYDACREMLQTRARRIPLVDVDDETGKEMVVSVITQYRILKFISVNVEETEFLKKSVSDIKLGTYGDLQTANMDTPVIDVIHMMVKHSISSVPIVDKDSRVLNLFEAVDVITIIKGGVYDGLTLTVGEALANRAEDFAGIYTCSEEDRLDSIFDTIRKSRVHRLVVIDEEQHLKGVISLSDILHGSIIPE
ncbi:hypothetical protein SS1G_03235 [Sclerotinia sclerotiorum 1980 UF-70]|uniref:CBS domain-containing protein n=1 Tax=Sclerotinia sclerotiorum (strain ATCC 18683 / 1980 / Ss-1) TaxID=665079 RepID=A7ED46_SCLS1|nr:hypothetical protein SS1G_03235 [Sclerotinia sclerotiorum 1980 UF-70]EDO00762.1 hypothetical protein SS1G_03235 [Sclerotinia sclerotiorum 1980 UF-70]